MDKGAHNICCFAGHGNLLDSGIIKKICSISEDLIINHNVKEFWVGNYGNFDRCAAFAIRELQKKYTDIELNLVIPYITKSINEHKALYCRNYNNIIIADIPKNTPNRFHIAKTNEFIVNNSDYLICYIEWSWGGAVKTYKYAKRKHLQIINIAEKPKK